MAIPIPLDTHSNKGIFHPNKYNQSYNFESWRDEMRNKLFMSCGVDEKQTIFLLNDT